MTSRATVLVCDDEPNLRELIRVSLGDDYAFVEATDGEQALELARRMRPDLVVLDLMMPRRNGLDVLAKLQGDAALADTRVIVVTAQPAAQEEARAMGADGVVVKPFNPADLADLAASLLQDRR